MLVYNNNLLFNMHGMTIKLWYVYSCSHHPEDGSMNDRNMSVVIYVIKLHL